MFLRPTPSEGEQQRAVRLLLALTRLSPPNEIAPEDRQTLAGLVCRLAALLPGHGAVIGIHRTDHAMLARVLARASRAGLDALGRGDASHALLAVVLCADEAVADAGAAAPSTFFRNHVAAHLAAASEKTTRVLEAIETRHRALLRAAARLGRLLDADALCTAIDASLAAIGDAQQAFATALLFDCARLRRGAELFSAPKATLDLFVGVEDARGRLRVGNALLFLVVAMREGVCQYFDNPATHNVAVAADAAAARAVVDHFSDAVRHQLFLFYRQSEAHCIVPAGSLRVLLRLVDEFVRMAATDPRVALAVRLAFCVPVLHTSHGRLGVWDVVALHCDRGFSLVEATAGTLAILVASLAGDAAEAEPEAGPEAEPEKRIRLQPSEAVRDAMAAELRTWPPSAGAAPRAAAPRERHAHRLKLAGSAALRLAAYEPAVIKQTPHRDFCGRAGARSVWAATAVAAVSDVLGPPVSCVVPLQWIYLHALELEMGGRCGPQPDAAWNWGDTFGGAALLLATPCFWFTARCLPLVARDACDRVCNTPRAALSSLVELVQGDVREVAATARAALAARAAQTPPFLCGAIDQFEHLIGSLRVVVDGSAWDRCLLACVSVRSNGRRPAPSRANGKANTKMSRLRNGCRQRTA
jgi:hypothetical protein